MSKQDLDLELLGFKHSLPPEAVDDLKLLVQSAANVAAIAAKKGSWVRAVVIGLCSAVFSMVGTAAWAGWYARGYISELATKTDIKKIGEQYAAVSAQHKAEEDKQNERLKDVEVLAGQALQVGAEAKAKWEAFLEGRIRSPR